MERRKFTREFKLEAVRLIKERGASHALWRSRGVTRVRQFRAGRREERVEQVANCRQCTNSRDRYEGANQAVLNGRRARLVVKHLKHDFEHGWAYSISNPMVGKNIKTGVNRTARTAANPCTLLKHQTRNLQITVRMVRLEKFSSAGPGC